MKDTKIEIIQRDSKNFVFNFTNSAGVVDITGWTLYFAVKKIASDTSTVLYKTVTSHTDPTQGTTALAITSSESNLTVGTYYYDIRVKTTGNSIFTIMKGNLEIQVGVNTSI